MNGAATQVLYSPKQFALSLAKKKNVISLLHDFGDVYNVKVDTHLDYSTREFHIYVNLMGIHAFGSGNTPNQAKINAAYHFHRVYCRKITPL